ncbi:RBBP9/YdeN family alpha/beta hydrolase [Andreprevotia chitinilytica]|uniref:RBBP9/YdeN family alpha/beta hydrolase n=1 Tax=Andreprevotia chitinilytica TaxID=396808 RepID=UPI0005553A84|nr:alpha/beta hydrolase [Andreprevotia chitinilytica]
MTQATLVVVPGLGNSGPEHWQTHWEYKYPGTLRVQQQNWDHPDRQSWIDTLDRTVRETPGKVVLIAHSLACALIANWASSAADISDKVLGALLVSPADVDSPEHTPAEAHVFAPMPTHRLPFRSLVIASDDDPYVDIDRARDFANAWGADCISIGSAGHINSKSNLGEWSAGQVYLDRLLSH